MLSNWAELILQPFLHFIYATAHSPTLPSLYLRHSSFSNPSVASPTSQLILQPFFRFSYVTGSSLTSPGEPPMPRRDVVVRVPAFQPGGPGLISAGPENLIYILGLVCPVCVLSCIFSGGRLSLCWPRIQGGPPLCLVLWSTVCCSPLQASGPRGV